MATKFQITVWGKLKDIPKGRVVTYGELARAVGKPKASRAVGSACGANSNLVVVPCHRVVTSNGLVGHYARGKEEKIKLLQKEGVKIEDEKIQNFKQTLFYWK